MATLVRPRRVEYDTDILKNIPAPFPVQHLIVSDDDVLNELAAEPVDYGDIGAARVAQRQSDIQASIAAVHHSCLMTLASILAPSSPLDVAAHPDESEQSTGPAISIHQVLSESPLSCLVHALRARDGHPDHPVAEAALLSQLHELVDAIAPTLARRDAHLAQAIVALLLDLEQLPSSLALASLQVAPQDNSSQDNENGVASSSRSPYAIITSLQRQLSSLQPSSSASSGSGSTPAENVRTGLLWARIDEQLETVMSLCKARASSPPQDNIEVQSPTRLVAQLSESQSCNSQAPFDDALPPGYDSEYPYERPPSYVAEGHLYAFSGERQFDEKRSAEQFPPEKISSRTSVSTLSVETGMTECDHTTSSDSLDLDGITHAIERLYVAAPQLANQRVELRKEKVMQMERAKEGKGKARTFANPTDPELDKMLDLLGRASAREIPDQRAVIDPHRTAHEKGAAEIEEQRRKYLEHLIHRTAAGRLHSQDAVPSLRRTYSSPLNEDNTAQDAESLERQLEGKDGKRASFSVSPKSGPVLALPSEKSRNRSVSAPHLAWLRPREKSGSANGAKEVFSSLTRTLSSDPKGLQPSATSKSIRGFSGKLRAASKSRSRPSSSNGEDMNHGALDIAYVAEHHETLKHVLLFIAHVSSSSSTPDVVPLAEVLPSTSSGTYGDCLFLRLAGTPSPPLPLPVPVVPGSKSVLTRGGHWEIKASCYQSGAPLKESDDMALLPASELASLFPSSYTCSSCSLPLISAPPARYRDLPSEHWEELIDAWMCHPEGQTLAKTGKGNGFIFWPTCDEALVGGSYILFDAQAIAAGNIRCVGARERGGHSRLAHCLCGAILGRQHDRREDDGSVSRMYRLFKYAIRPTSATSQVPKIPMSAFVLHDMLEHVQAHATYRFVLLDEEDEKPRLLIWLFKPRIRISYMLPTPALLPKSGTVDGSKVLYKILGPTSVTSEFKDILNKYPGFPQAEYLFYPMDVCRKLAALLKESTGSYPESMRTMTGLDVGWLTVT